MVRDGGHAGAEGPGEAPAARCPLQAGRVGMDVGAPAAQAPLAVEDGPPVDEREALTLEILEGARPTRQAQLLAQLLTSLTGP